MTDDFEIRAARAGDELEIHAMICELAEFEKLTHQVVSTPETIRDSLFGDGNHAEALLATDGDRAIAFALFFHNFSTFIGKPGLYLEDLYVRSAYRQRGVGKSLLVQLAKVARERDCGRFEWSVLDWNSNAIEFYKGLGADVLPDWRVVRLDQDGIKRLAD